MKRTKYTAKFKSEAFKQILDKRHSTVEVSSRLGVPVGLLYNWARKLKEPDVTPIEDVKALQAEMTKLKAELRRTTEERDILKKGRRILCQSVRVKYAFIKEHRQEFRLLSIRQVLKVYRSGYYAWLKEPQSPRALENAKLSERIATTMIKVWCHISSKLQTYLFSKPNLTCFVALSLSRT